MRCDCRKCYYFSLASGEKLNYYRDEFNLSKDYLKRVKGECFNEIGFDYGVRLIVDTTRGQCNHFEKGGKHHYDYPSPETRQAYRDLLVKTFETMMKLVNEPE